MENVHEIFITIKILIYLHFVKNYETDKKTNNSL